MCGGGGGVGGNLKAPLPIPVFSGRISYWGGVEAA